MSDDLYARLYALTLKIHRELDRIHNEALAKLESLARATGQRTRMDRL